MSDSLTYARLASKLLRDLDKAENDTVTGDDAIHDKLSLILKAFEEVDDLAAARLEEQQKKDCTGELT